MSFLVNNKKGFTMIEFLVVIVIATILFSISVKVFYSYKNNHSIDSVVARISGALEEARFNTVSAKNDSVYGVKFTTNSVSLFQGSSYNPNDINNKTYNFNNTVSINSVLNGGVSSIVFDRQTGATNHFGTTTITSTASSTIYRYVVVYKTGVIEVK
jgi:prepilin-type N-terminal cleavage/methylation domain-containing protein